MKKETIINALNKFMSQTSSSLNSVAAQSGISIATLSNMINNKHEGIHDRQWNKLGAFLKLDPWVRISTFNHELVTELCTDAKVSARCMAIVAESGFGKTDALIDFKMHHPNVIYVLGHILLGGKKQFLTAVQKAIGVLEGSTPSEMLDAITDKLNSLDQPLLIIDDAGKLNETNLRILQIIYDRTFRQCGIILAGTPYLKMYIEYGVKRNRMGFSELYRRIEYWQQLFPPSREEMKVVCEANGITTPRIVKFIQERAKNFGTLRAMIMHAQRLELKNELSVEKLSMNGIKLAEEVAA